MEQERGEDGVPGTRLRRKCSTDLFRAVPCATACRNGPNIPEFRFASPWTIFGLSFRENLSGQLLSRCALRSPYPAARCFTRARQTANQPRSSVQVDSGVKPALCSMDSACPRAYL